MPRLDGERIDLWRRLRAATQRIDRALDAGLVELHGLPLRHFEVLAALRDGGGSRRVHALCSELSELPSSLSRRLDRLEEDGLVRRAATPSADDARAVTVTLTHEGRLSWRDANITYRRLLQSNFAQSLTDSDIAAVTRLLGKW